MVCPCGARFPDRDEFCCFCGARNAQYQPPAPDHPDPGQPPYPDQPLDPWQTPSPGQPQRPGQQPYRTQPPYQGYQLYNDQRGHYQHPEQQRSNRTARVALICGIVGLFIAGLILGVIAITQGAKAKAMGHTGGKATAGIVLGVIDIVGWIIIIMYLF